MELREREIDAIRVFAVFRLLQLPLDLAQPSGDVPRDGEPFGTDDLSHAIGHNVGVPWNRRNVVGCHVACPEYQVFKQ